MSVRIGVLASGKGSNLRNLLDRGYDVAAMATNRRDCGAAAIAAAAGVALGVFPQGEFASRDERDLAMRDWLSAQGVGLVVLAGYDRVLSGAFVAAWPGRVLNIHPSLLPAFAGGMDAVEQALAFGVKVSGCTVHLVTDAVDAGPILRQAAVPVEDGDTAATLHARIQVEEHRILPEAIDSIGKASPTLRQ